MKLPTSLLYRLSALLILVAPCSHAQVPSVRPYSYSKGEQHRMNQASAYGGSPTPAPTPIAVYEETTSAPSTYTASANIVPTPVPVTLQPTPGPCKDDDFIVTVNITSPCMYTLFVNGENLGQSYGGVEILKYNILVPNSYDVVVAVRGFCYTDPNSVYGSCHAFKASVSMCGVEKVTDYDDWICSSDNSDPSWASSPDYDTSTWSNASAVTCPAGNADTWDIDKAIISPNADWIWAAPAVSQPVDAQHYSSSYCRLKLPNTCKLCPGHTAAPTAFSLFPRSSPAPTPAPTGGTPAPTPCVSDRNLYLTATSTCDFTVYIADQLFTYAMANQIATYIYSVGAETAVPVAITGTCTESQLRGVTKGIISKLQFCDRTWVTQAEWRCGNLDSVGQGWTNSDYDDSDWSPAESVGLEVTQTIFPDAAWIWSYRFGGSSGSQSRNTVCRFVLPARCSFCPTQAPTTTPTPSPTALPTTAPTPCPTPAPTPSPTGAPTGMPTLAPTAAPTGSPTIAPTGMPTQSPTAAPTGMPTSAPTPSPTLAPTVAPTGAPTSSPTPAPTVCVEPDKTLTLSLASSCWYKVYVNGEFIGQGYTALEVETFTSQVPYKDGVDVTLAVKGYCKGSYAGGAVQTNLAAFLGQVELAGCPDGKIYTDCSWQCTYDCPDPDWAEPGYDDSMWVNATVVNGYNGVQPWGAIEGISKKAKWIWSTDDFYFTNVGSQDAGPYTGGGGLDRRGRALQEEGGSDADPEDATAAGKKDYVPAGPNKLFAYAYCRKRIPQCSICDIKAAQNSQQSQEQQAPSVYGTGAQQWRRWWSRT